MILVARSQWGWIAFEPTTEKKTADRKFSHCRNPLATVLICSDRALDGLKTKAWSIPSRCLWKILVSSMISRMPLAFTWSNQEGNRSLACLISKDWKIAFKSSRDVQAFTDCKFVGCMASKRMACFSVLFCGFFQKASRLFLNRHDVELLGISWRGRLDGGP